MRLVYPNHGTITSKNTEKKLIKTVNHSQFESAINHTENVNLST